MEHGKAPRNKSEHVTRFYFEPRDLWIGLYWDHKGDGFHYYVCLIPTLVIHWKPCMSFEARAHRQNVIFATIASVIIVALIITLAIVVGAFIT